MNLDGIRRLLFVLIATVPAVFVSERVYWHADRSLGAQMELLAFYAVAMVAVLWLISRHRVSNVWSLLLVVPVFAYIVEGVIVPVLYTGGPLVPFFPALFTFWHGTFGVVLVLVMFRRWLLAGRWKPLLGSSTLIGSYWGMWALTAAVPDDDPMTPGSGHEAMEILSAGSFAVYVTVCTAALMAAHFTLSSVWLTTFVPSTAARTVWFVAVGATIVGWTFVFPWAAPMFAAYAGLQLWALRRLPEHDEPTLLEQLAGRFPWHRLWPLVSIPATASISYAFWIQQGLSVEAIENHIFIVSSSLQAVVGLGILIASHAKAVRRNRRGPASPDLNDRCLLPSTT